MKYLTLLLLGLGVLTRLGQYLYNRPFWGDEIALIANLTNRSFLGLLAPLERAQAAPVGFLWMEKLSLELLGDSTYALRLIPLLAGIASIFLFWLFVHRVAPRAVLVALSLFVTSNWLIYYANETKQYSLDVAIALGLLVLYAYRARAQTLAAAGMLAIWFSHPAIFILAGIGFSWLFRDGNRRPALSVGAMWLLSFGLAYVALYSKTASHEGLLEYWTFKEPAFVDPEPLSIARAVIETFLLVSGLYQPFTVVLVIVGFLYGVWSARTEYRVLCLSPILFAATAAALHKYPYIGRFILFLMPGLTVMVALGLTNILSRLSANRRWLFVAIAVALLLPSFAQIDVNQDGLYR